MGPRISVLVISGLAILFGAAFRSSPRISFGAETAVAKETIPELPRQIVPKESEREGLRARLVLRDHGTQDGKGMYSLGIEIENASYSTMARVEFDPKDLTLELLDAQGKAISPSSRQASAPAQLAYQVVIPGNSSVTLPTHDHGYGFAGVVWANDQTVWQTPSGKYQIKGTVIFTVSYGKPHLDGPNGDRVTIPLNWEEKPMRVEVKIPLSQFTLAAAD